MTSEPDDPPDDARAQLKAEIIASGFDEAAAERLLSGPPAIERRPVPRYENKGKREGPFAGGGATGSHTSTRGGVDGGRE